MKRVRAKSQLVSSLLVVQIFCTSCGSIWGGVYPSSLSPTAISQDLVFTHGTLPSGLFVSRAGPASYYSVGGTLTASAPNTARLDYDPLTHAALGLLIEPATTNQVIYGQDFTNGAWFDTGSVISVALAQGTAPDGTNTANKLTDPGSGSYDGLDQGVPNVSGTSFWTASAYLKNVNSTQSIIQAYICCGGTGVTGGILLNWTGSVPSFSSHNGEYSYGFQNVGNGWWRIWATSQDNASGNATAGFGIVPDTFTTGKSILIWGAQLEHSQFPSSYIATSNVAVTRNADIVQQTSLGGWYNQTAGTWLFKATPTAVPASGTAWLFSGVGALPANNNYGMSASSVSGNALSYSITQGGIPEVVTISAGGALVPGTALKAGFSYSSAISTASTNGLSGLSSVSQIIPVITTLNIGSDSNGSNVFSGHVTEFVYYPAFTPGAVVP